MGVTDRDSHSGPGCLLILVGVSALVIACVSAAVLKARSLNDEPAGQLWFVSAMALTVGVVAAWLHSRRR